jgi:hypothetical protein
MSFFDVPTGYSDADLERAELEGVPVARAQLVRAAAATTAGARATPPSIGQIWPPTSKSANTAASDAIHGR